jgi:hypothetical protein
MGWTVNDQEMAGVLALPGNRRYEYFVKRAAGHGELWALRGEDGWVVAEDDQRLQHFPVWPHPRYAQLCADDAWRDGTPVSIDVDEWVENWLPDLGRDGMRIAVFQTPNDEGVSVSPKRLKRDLADELSLFEY